MIAVCFLVVSYTDGRRAAALGEKASWGAPGGNFDVAAALISRAPLDLALEGLTPK